MSKKNKEKKEKKIKFKMTIGMKDGYPRVSIKNGLVETYYPFDDPKEMDKMMAYLSDMKDRMAKTDENWATTK